MYDTKFNHKNACALEVAISYLFLKENVYKRFYGVICSFSESLNEQSNDCSCTETQVLFVW